MDASFTRIDNSWKFEQIFALTDVSFTRIDSSWKCFALAQLYFLISMFLLIQKQ